MVVVAVVVIVVVTVAAAMLVSSLARMCKHEMIRRIHGSIKIPYHDDGENHNLHCSADLIKTIISERVRWMNYIGMKAAFRNLVLKYQ
jgi:hypothetical protein